MRDAGKCDPTSQTHRHAALCDLGTYADRFPCPRGINDACGTAPFTSRSPLCREQCSEFTA